MNFTDAVKKFDEEFLVNQKPSTARAFRSYLRRRVVPVFGLLQLEEITPGHINQAVLRWKMEELSVSTIEKLVLIVTLMRRHFNLGTFVTGSISIPKSVTEVVDAPCFTSAMSAEIVRRAKGVDKMLFFFLAGTGIRIGEALGLKVPDIDLVRGIVHVRRTLFYKTEMVPKSENGKRWLPIDDELLRAMRVYIGDRQHGYVFPNRHGGPMTQPKLLDRLHLILDELGIERCGFHAFRHGRCSYLVEHNVPMHLIEQFLGHGSAKMVKRYTHLRPEYARKNLPPPIPMLASIF